MPEVRLVDANAVKKALTGWDDNPTDEEIEHTIDGLPTVDAVPVVRCRECKEYVYPAGVCKHWIKPVPCDGYCNWGAKMDGGAEG